MKQTADFVIIFLVVSIILAIRRIWKYWFGSAAKKLPQKTTAESAPMQILTQINHNTVNILVVTEKDSE